MRQPPFRTAPCIATFVAAVIAACSAAPSPLWQIGQSDRDTAKLALGPGGYRDYRTDGFFVVGRSNPKQDWPYVHPGPADSWAGSQPHSFVVVFGLKAAPAAGPCRLVVELADTHNPRPPLLRAVVNGRTFELQLPSGGGDASIFGAPGKGRPFSWSIPVPPEALHPGDNQLVLTTVSGSWMLYDSVRMETPAGTELAPVSARNWLGGVEMPPCWLKQGDQAVQPLKVTIYHFGEEQEATCRLDNLEVGNVSLKNGANLLELKVPTTRVARRSSLSLAAGGQILAATNLTLAPPPIQELWLLPHSHVDIGYTHRQSEAADIQVGNLIKAMQLARASATNTEGHRFKWNPEAVWTLDQFLSRANPQERQTFMDSVKNGAVGVDALYANLLTGLCRPEELAQGLAFGARLARLTGVPLRAAAICDVPGYTWGMVPVMAQAGVKYFAIGPNGYDRVGSIHTWDDKPFYWKSQSGRERVLCWVVDNYWHHGELEPEVMGHLGGLIRSGFAYDMCFMWWVGSRPNGGLDNAPPDEQTVAKVQAWNAKYAAPRILIGLSGEFFERFERRHGSKVPEFGGDLTPYWEDGAGSAARETALNRATAERLSQALALFAIRAPGAYPVQQFDEAWKNTLLFSEHTWGAWCSISKPDDPFTLDQWKTKASYAEAADRQSRQLLLAAISPRAAGSSSTFDVFNTTQWPRTDLVAIPSDLAAGAGEVVVDETGQAVRTQQLASGERVFLAREVPPFGGKRYRLEPNAVQPPVAAVGANASDTILSTSTLRVELDAASGAVKSLRLAGLGREFVDASAPVGLNDFRYVLGTNVQAALSNGPVSFSVIDAGPLVATVRVKSAAPGCVELIRDVRVVEGLNRVELLNQVNRRSVREKDAVHFGFGFRVPGGALRMETPWAIVRPNVDQLAGACRNWYTVQRWVNISGENYGIDWAPLDAPLMEIGGMTANLLGGVSLNEWLTRAPDSQTLYSWAQNNHWHTNYKIDQPGVTTFRYLLRPHRGGYSAADSARFGLETSRPLLAVPVDAASLPSRSLLSISTPDVVIETLKVSDDGRALVLRLQCLTEKSQTARLQWHQKQPAAVFLSDLAERPLSKLGNRIRVQGHGMMTVRAEFDGVQP